MEKEILAKIKELRTKKGYTAAYVANKLNIVEDSYKKIENGTNKSWSKYLFDLLELYQVSLSDFFSDISGKNFISQEIRDNRGQSTTIGIQNSETNYADKTIVKSLFNEKDKRIDLLEHKIKVLEKELETLKLENAYLKGKNGL